LEKKGFLMRVVRFQADGGPKYGVVEDDVVREISGDVFGRFRGTRKKHPLKRLRFLPPTQPTKIVGIGFNYRDHAAELGFEPPDEPVIYIKPGTSVLPHLGKILYPKDSNRVDYEAELAIVIGRYAREVPPKKAARHIFGYTCFNDVTARDLQRKDRQWTRSKSFETFAPVGPWVETALDPSDALVRAFLNGELKQSANTASFIFDVPTVVSFITRVMPLFPGDIIATGTPAGIGPMKPGDTIEIEIEGIGRLRNTVTRKT
jgi:2-keto-4-pentenoate hydratase/2-oxohepta-3-ene-1,7-dioic acid hydratase in catechol pathway